MHHAKADDSLASLPVRLMRLGPKDEPIKTEPAYACAPSVLPATANSPASASGSALRGPRRRALALTGRSISSAVGMPLRAEPSRVRCGWK
jgi:hypothetical protein